LGGLCAAPRRARKPSHAQRFKAAYAACEAQGDDPSKWGAAARDPAWATRQAAVLAEIEAEDAARRAAEDAARRAEPDE
jgi:hypothetical protein